VDVVVITVIADDTYLVIPAVNCSTCTAEVKHIETWATTNNLRLNRAKSKEIVFFANGKRRKQAFIPPPCPTIERVHSLRVLGIIVNTKLTAADHVDHLLVGVSKSTVCGVARSVQQWNCCRFTERRFSLNGSCQNFILLACVLLLIGHA